MCSLNALWDERHINHRNFTNQFYKGAYLLLMFSQDGAIRLETRQFQAFLRDTCLPTKYLCRFHLAMNSRIGMKITG